jgi:hypothetical protein
MSDEIFEVVTHSVDVAALGQDYSDRVDGERILLGLPRALEVGDEVRFVVLLLDGTPAFAGAGRCVQVNDQGSNAGVSRFDTLIDSLAFDERSAPVYEYIVAVRQLAYQEAESAGSDESIEAGGGDVDVAMPSSAPPEPSPWDAEATRIGRGSIPPEAHRPAPARDLAAEAYGDRTTPHEFTPSSLPTPVPTASATARPRPVGSSVLPEPSEPEPLSVAAQPRRVIPPAYTTIPPEPLKTGILTRPALAAHWAPAAPRPPHRSLRPTSFQSHPGPLAVPEVPPRPKIDRSQWIERAPAPH